MSSKPAKKVKAPAPMTREELLVSIWERTAATVDQALAADAPSAAVIVAARQFLQDNGVSIDSLPQLKRTRGGLPSNIGTLPFAGSDEAAPTEAPLPSNRSVDHERDDDPNK